jgi:SAM-dependent methyltransferase
MCKKLQRIEGIRATLLKDSRGIFFPLRRIFIRGILRGVTSRYTSAAEADIKNLTGVEATYKNLLGEVFSKLRLDYPQVILEVGSGAGSLTFPVLDSSSSRVIATDISVNQLRILAKSAKARGLDDRLEFVQIDNSVSYFSTNHFEMIVGAAIAHHIINPIKFIESLGHSLKPGGVIVLFEPIRSGSLLVRNALKEVNAEIGRVLPESIRTFFSDIVADIEARDPALTRLSLWQRSRLDDKSFVDVELLQRSLKGWGVTVVSVLDSRQGGIMTQHVVNILRSYLHWDDMSVFPSDFWGILSRYDSLFSEDLASPVIEGCVVLRKPSK